MRLLTVAVALFALMLAGCGDDGTGTEGTGYLNVQTFDAPPPPLDVQAINLHITEVSAHHVGEGWMVLAHPDSVYDFLELINGVTAVLVDTSLPAGEYTQLRLVVSDSNEIVIGEDTVDLVVPSGQETGVKIQLGFDVEADDTTTVFVDFEAAKSITWTPDRYLLRPSYRAFRQNQAVLLSGTVIDTFGNGIENALVEASDAGDTVTTMTAPSGDYTLYLEAGTYQITASASGYSQADTTYTGVVIDPNSQSDTTGFDFVLE